MKSRIEAEYIRRGDTLGWRFLSCPLANIDRASIAFIGINPGGRAPDKSNDGLSVEAGSAYRVETWGDCPAGQSPLQKQVLGLYALIGVDPGEVLSGNLIPFRSPRLSDLNDRYSATKFGQSIWYDILSRSKVKTVITMGQQATRPVSEMFDVRLKKRPSGWGNISLQVGQTEQYRFLGLPHLSTFKLLSRSESVRNLKAAWQN